MLGIPKFSEVQKILRRVFKKGDGLIHVFTEDKKEDQIFYELLLTRLNSETLKIASITPLGSRADVMKKSLEDKSPQAPSLYIIDGDIDLLMSAPIESKNLIGLDRYCIENYLCCENGLISLLQTNYGETTDYYRSRLEFHSILHKFCKVFLKITIRYHVAQDLKCSTGFKKASDFFHIRPGGVFELDKNKVNDEILRVEKIIKDKLKQKGIKSFKAEMERLINEVEANNTFTVNQYLKVISGKDFILPILEKKIKLVEGRLNNWTTDQIKRNLAERIDIRSLDRIKLKMERMV